MLFVGTSIIHPSTEGVFLLCNILDLLIYSLKIMVTTKKGKLRKAKIRKAMKYFLGRFRELAVLNYPVNQGNLRQMI